MLGGILFEYHGKSAELTIPDGITVIDIFAFQSVKSLTSIIIPDSVTEIRTGALKGCSGLADDRGYVIVRGVMYDYFGKETTVADQDREEKNKADKDLGIRKLSANDWKNTYNFKKTEGDIAITRYKGRDTEVVIPSMIGRHKVTAIGKEAFSPLQRTEVYYMYINPGCSGRLIWCTE